LNARRRRTYLPIVLMKTKLVLAGKSKVEIGRALKAAMDGKDCRRWSRMRCANDVEADSMSDDDRPGIRT